MARNEVVEPVTLAVHFQKKWCTSAVARNEVIEPVALAKHFQKKWWTLLGLNQ